MPYGGRGTIFLSSACGKFSRADNVTGHIAQLKKTEQNEMMSRNISANSD